MIGTRLIYELGIPIFGTTLLYAHSTSVRLIANLPVLHECTKHIEVAFYFIHQYVLYEAIDLPHVSSHNQLADLFTKSVPRPCHDFLISKLILIPTRINLKDNVEIQAHDSSPSHQTQ